MRGLGERETRKEVDGGEGLRKGRILQNNLLRAYRDLYSNRHLLRKVIVSHRGIQIKQIIEYNIPYVL